MNESKHIHITNTNDFDKLRFLCKSGNKKFIAIGKSRFARISGNTAGQSEFMSFPAMKKRVEKLKPSVCLQSSSYGFSRLKKVNGELVFPDFRELSGSLKQDVDKLEEEIKQKRAEIDKILSDRFEEQPLLRAELVFDAFDIENKSNKDVLFQALDELGFKEVEE